MKEWFKKFFSVSNEINENIVVGAIFAIAFLVATFLDFVPEAKYYILGGMVATFFGIGAFKK